MDLEISNFFPRREHAMNQCGHNSITLLKDPVNVNKTVDFGDIVPSHGLCAGGVFTDQECH